MPKTCTGCTVCDNIYWPGDLDLWPSDL